MQNTDRILIIKLSAIGDLVHSLPFLEVIRNNFPYAKIDWVVEEEASRIILGHPAINRMIISRRKSWQKRLLKIKESPAVLRETIRFLKEIKANDYDLVIDLQGLLKSGVLVGFSRSERKVGMSGGREGRWVFLNERISVDYTQHAIDRYLKLAEYLGCEFTSWHGHIPILEPDKERINHLLNYNGLIKRPIISINPMARWESKLWAPKRFAELADRLQDELSCRIIFSGSEKDRAVIDDISMMMKEKPVNLAGKTTLKELAYLYSKCQCLVTTDTGPMHIAAAMGCRVVGLFGPTAPWRTGPYGKGHEVIMMGVECSPCFMKKCGHMTCMNNISVERVFGAVRDMVM
ncbi:MAG: lipopolysaccharide heptosyltransferase II [Desulfobacterales bacterium]|nr:lipopolysaccharide heptosyltransferase II [Desulfobacterales bacterium]